MTDAAPLIRSGLFLRAEQRDALLELSRSSDAPVSALIRRAIDNFLELARRRGDTGSAAIDSLLR